MTFNRWMAAAAVVMAAAAGQAQAQLPVPKFIRGVVTQASADTVVVKDKQGVLSTVTMAPTWTVAVMKPIGVDAIQPGSFIGTAEMPQADGVGKSLEVHIFPPGVKMGEGHYGWDLKPGSMMTNGTVGKVVASKDGRELDVSYSYGTRKIIVPPKVPIVQITPGDRSMVKPGVKVFMVAQSSGTKLTAASVSVGEKGKAPAM